MTLPGSVDVHTHLAPVLPDGADGVAADGERLVVDGHAVGPLGLYRPDALEAYLDDAGLESAVVSPPPPFFRQELDPAAAAAWVRALNDGVLRSVAGRTRLLPLAYLPLEHPDVAVAEYAALRGDARWAGVTASAGGRSQPLDGEALAPLWRMLDEDGRTLLLHPGTSADARLDRHYLANLLGNPAETGMAAAELVFGAVLSTYPRVRVVLSHCGGVVPSVVGRWQRGYDTDRPGVARLELPPREAVRRLYVDDLAHDPAVVDLAVEVFGADRLLVGSDWPFPMGSSDPLALIAHRGAEAQRRAAVDNAAAALGRRATQTA
ncbi:amidohydrolase family protein [Georgenia sp. SYP-B2076]|uniref:amidohydrolase family protein n=1 Tax=Georgenia sp. SYP-B2076 TaxID=2495881 RepID=UPI000F8C9399|nr:amidohydrolase family protein [Georgenia sp. SYP-B2076]